MHFRFCPTSFNVQKIIYYIVVDCFSFSHEFMNDKNDTIDSFFIIIFSKWIFTFLKNVFWSSNKRVWFVCLFGQRESYLGSTPSSGSSSWVLWRDVAPEMVQRERRSRLYSALLSVAVCLVVLAVLAIAGLAIYMGGIPLSPSPLPPPPPFL